MVHELCAANYLQMMRSLVNGIKDDDSTNGILSFGMTDGNNKVIIKSPYSSELSLEPTALVGRMNELLAAGRMSPALQTKIGSAVASVQGTSPADKLKRAKIAAFLTMASTDYLVQK